MVSVPGSASVSFPASLPVLLIFPLFFACGFGSAHGSVSVRFCFVSCSISLDSLKHLLAEHMIPSAILCENVGFRPVFGFRFFRVRVSVSVHSRFDFCFSFESGSVCFFSSLVSCFYPCFGFRFVDSIGDGSTQLSFRVSVVSCAQWFPPGSISAPFQFRCRSGFFRVSVLVWLMFGFVAVSGAVTV